MPIILTAISDSALLNSGMLTANEVLGARARTGLGEDHIRKHGARNDY
jgi:hypothetical protein